MLPIESLLALALGRKGRSHTVTPEGGSLANVLRVANPGDVIFLRPGEYADVGTITIPRDKSGLVLVGTGGLGAAYIQPSTAGAVALVVHADDVTLVNVGLAGGDETAAAALRVTGARFRAHGCKIENGVAAAILGPGTVAQEAAGTHGDGADALFEDCEFCWAASGLMLVSSDYGAVTQTAVRGSRFHNLTGDAIGEDDVSTIGAVRDLLVEDCVFANQEDGSAPDNYLNVASTGSTGLVTRSRFACAESALSAKTAYPTSIKWVGNESQGASAPSNRVLGTIQPNQSSWNDVNLDFTGARALINGAFVAFGSQTVDPLAGTISDGDYGLFVFTVDAAGAIDQLPLVTAPALSGLVYPAVPAGKAVAGAWILQATGANFVGGTTSLYTDAEFTPNANVTDVGWIHGAALAL